MRYKIPKQYIKADKGQRQTPLAFNIVQVFAHFTTSLLCGTLGGHGIAQIFLSQDVLSCKLFFPQKNQLRFHPSSYQVI